MAVFVTHTARLVAASAVATLADVGALVGLVAGAHVARGPAATAACVVGGAVNFVLCRRWLAGPRTRAAHGLGLQAALYGLLVVLGGSLWSGLVVDAASVRLGLPLLGAKAVAAALVLVAWNYPISAHLVFRKEARHGLVAPVPVDRDPRLQRG